MPNKQQNNAEFEPVYISMGRESWSRVIAICVLTFAGVWFFFTLQTAVLVTVLLALLLSGYVQVFTYKVLGPLADNLSVWMTTRRTGQIGETAVTDKDNPMWIGYYNNGDAVITNLDDLESVAIWGIKGTGKTTLLHTMIYEMTCAYTPEDLHVVIFDHGKDGNDYSVFNHMPYLHGVPIAESDTDADRLLLWLDGELQRRGKLLKEIPDRYLCNDLKRYHQWRERLHLEDQLPRLPHLAIVIDEAQDLTGNKKALETLIKIAKKGRYVGMFLIVATQYPNTEAIPGGLRSQLGTRFCGFLASGREYHIVAEITKDFTEGVRLGVGQFFVRLIGYPTWMMMNAIMIPEEELTAYAARISRDHPVPTWQSASTLPIIETTAKERPFTQDDDEPLTRISWRGLPGSAAKQVAFMEFLRQYDERPNAPTVMEHFEMTRKTAYAALNKYWPMREKELRR